VSTELDIAKLVVPGLLAAGGAYLGGRVSAGAAEKAELRALLDECAAVLERADQRRVSAETFFITEGLNTTEKGTEAVNAFRQELSLAAQLRDRLLFRMHKNAAPPIRYLNALLALGRASTALGLAVMLPSDQPYDLSKVNDKLTAAEKDFKEERAAFLESVQHHLAGRRLPRSLVS
jgi:hypothetical protein